MKSAFDLLELHSQVREINLQLVRGLASLVGTTFKCEKNRIITWENITDVVEWRVTAYDSDREQFEVRHSEDSMSYYPSEVFLLRLLDDIDGVAK